MSVLAPVIDPASVHPKRRESARARCFMMVRASGAGEPMWAWDIALGGVNCQGRQPRWPGTYLDMHFRLPNSDDRLEVGAQVVSLDQIDDTRVSMGLRFGVGVITITSHPFLVFMHTDKLSDVRLDCIDPFSE